MSRKPQIVWIARCIFAIGAYASVAYTISKIHSTGKEPSECKAHRLVYCNGIQVCMSGYAVGWCCMEDRMLQQRSIVGCSSDEKRLQEPSRNPVCGWPLWDAPLAVVSSWQLQAYFTWTVIIQSINGFEYGLLMSGSV